VWSKGWKEEEESMGEKGEKVGVWKNYLVDEAIIKDWTADLLEHLIQCLNLTHTDCPITNPQNAQNHLAEIPCLLPT
jgi:hypothetical protein